MVRDIGVLAVAILLTALVAGPGVAGAAAGEAGVASPVAEAAAPTGAPIDWDAVGKEAADLLSQYIRIDTTNPPGNETPAARFLAGVLTGAGIEAEVAEGFPGRGNVYARRPGSGDGGAIILLHHMDVVPADAAEWSVPPFAGVVRDGFVYGRGALDCKGVGIAALMATLLLERHHQDLNLDVIFLGTADEETGGTQGAGWVTGNRPAWFQGATSLLNEGDHIHLDEGKRPVAHLAVAEKTPCWLRLTARGQGGHGSAPPPQTAVTRLIRALDRVDTYRPPARVVPAVAKYFEALAADGDPAAAPFADLGAVLADPERLASFDSDPRRSALVRNSITPTVLAASTKINVIPAVASAELDCRLLPGERPETFIETIRGVIDDPTIEIETVLSFPASSSPSDGPLPDAIRRVMEQQLGGPTVPSVLTGFTDSHFFRDLLIPSYGFVPFAQLDAERHRVHGIDERIAVQVLQDGIRFLYHLLLELGGAPRGPAG